MNQKLVRGRSTWISYGQVGAFGWFLYGFGPAMSLLSDEQDTSPVVMSLHMTALALGTIIMGFVASHSVTRWGRARVLQLGGFGLVAGLSLIVVAPITALTLFGALITGTAAAALVTINISFLDQEHGPASPVAVTEANSFAALGGLLSPLALGMFVSIGWGWRTGMVIAIILFIALEALRGPRDAYDLNPTPRKTDGTRHKFTAQYWWAWFTVACTSGIEYILMLWSTDLLRERAGMGDAAAVAGIATFTSGLFLGRLAIGRLARFLNPEKLFASTFIATFFVFWIFWLSSSQTIMLAALFTLGLTMAGQWPLGVSRVVKAGSNNPDQASALTAFATGGSGMLLPVLLGGIAQAVDIHTAFLVFPLVVAAGLFAALIKPLSYVKN